MLTYDRYLTPASLAEAFDSLQAERESVRVLAGATDILPWAREGRAGDVHYGAIVDITGVPELSGVSLRDGRVSMGACATIGEFLSDRVLRSQVPVLAHCAVWFADDQIREQATVGGNVVNASPAGDTTPPLLALNASVTLYRRDGNGTESRILPLSEFVLGPSETALREGELLGRIEIDALPDHGAAFEKAGHRRSLLISTACVAAVVKPDAQRRCFSDVRIAIGGVGPVPERLVAAEAMLLGKRVSSDLIREAALTAASRVKSRTRREYRREVVANFVTRAVATALKRAGVPEEVIGMEEASRV
jgi:xanthine dehydrogenase FAD-binding subunit